MGNVQCCSTRNKNKKYNNIKINVDLQNTIIRRMTNKKLEYNISKQKKEKNENIYFAVIYGVGATGSVVLLFFCFEPSVCITSFLMSSTLSYYVNKIYDNKNSIKLFKSELERRKNENVKLIDQGKLYIHNQ